MRFKRIRKSLHFLKLGEKGKSVFGLIISFLGGAILLCAWCAQSVFQPKFLDQKLYLEKTQFLNEINQAEMAIWTWALGNQEQSEPIHAHTLALYYHECCRLSHKMLAHEYIRTTLGNDSTAIIYKNLKLKLIKNALCLVVRKKPSDAKASLAELHKMTLPQFDDYVNETVKKVETNNVLKNILNNVIFPTDFSDQEKQEAVYGLIVLYAELIDVSQLKENSRKDLDNKYSNLLAESRKSETEWMRMYLCAYAIGSFLIGLRWFLVNVLLWPDKFAGNTLINKNNNAHS